MNATHQDASRFLMQATLGADQETIDKVAAQGREAWLEQQLATPADDNGLFQRNTRAIWQNFRRQFIGAYGEAAINGDGNDPALPYKWYFRMAWWQQTLSHAADHQLRHRVAQALSEILVISDNSALELDAVGMAGFYDLLYRHAFGNYTDLLYDVSLHPCMGVYLSHMNNRKAEPARHIHPDENYAREIMQLFTIGLFELNPDGSRKQDAAGRDIPSYDNQDIKQLARVFTGLKAHSYRYEWLTSFWSEDYNGYPVEFDDEVEKTYKTVPFVDMSHPMEVDENYHDRGAKRLLKGHIKLPGKQSAQTEIRTVVERLVAHPNTAPFIARKLIQQMVTSNPTPDYVRTVAKAFGSRGDLKATVREILHYPLKRPASIPRGDARVQSQKLKSPLLRVTQLLRTFRADNASGRYWLTGEDLQEMLTQHPVSSPTVFNFYKPDFSPHGPLDTQGLVAPEFELHTSATSIAYVNLMYYWFFGEHYPQVSTQISRDRQIKNAPEFDDDFLHTRKRDHLRLDFSRELAIAADPSRHNELIDHVSLKLTGKTNLPIAPAIRKAFQAYRDQPSWVVQTVVFMIAISPEFTVLEA